MNSNFQMLRGKDVELVLFKIKIRKSFLVKNSMFRKINGVLISLSGYKLFTLKTPTLKINKVILTSNI